MQSQLANKNKAVVYRITIAQFAVTLLITVILFIVAGLQAAYSALLAGLISTLSTIFVGGRFFFSTTASTARDRLASIYIAELLKIVFVVIAFCAGFLLLDIHFPAFIGAYLATVIVYWLAMIWPVFGVQIKMKT